MSEEIEGPLTRELRKAAELDKRQLTMTALMALLGYGAGHGGASLLGWKHPWLYGLGTGAVSGGVMYGGLEWLKRRRARPAAAAGGSVKGAVKDAVKDAVVKGTVKGTVKGDAETPRGLAMPAEDYVRRELREREYRKPFPKKKSLFHVGLDDKVGEKDSDDTSKSARPGGEWLQSELAKRGLVKKPASKGLKSDASPVTKEIPSKIPRYAPLTGLESETTTWTEPAEGKAMPGGEYLARKLREKRRKLLDSSSLFHVERDDPPSAEELMASGPLSAEELRKRMETGEFWTTPYFWPIESLVVGPLDAEKLRRKFRKALKGSVYDPATGRAGQYNRMYDIGNKDAWANFDDFKDSWDVLKPFLEKLTGSDQFEFPDKDKAKYWAEELIPKALKLYDKHRKTMNSKPARRRVWLDLMGGKIKPEGDPLRQMADDAYMLLDNLIFYGAVNASNTDASKTSIGRTT